MRRLAAALATLLLALPAHAQFQGPAAPYLSGGGGCLTIGTTQICGTSTSIAGMTAIGLTSAGTLSWNSDLYLERAAAANLRLGDVDAAAPVAQTLSVQNVVAGTSNTAGASLTIKGSQSTGTGAGGSIIFQTAPAGSTGTSVNSLATGLTLAPTGASLAAQANTVPLTVSGYSLTGSSASSLLSLSGTLNTSGSPDVVSISITDTARGANTTFFNLLGGASGTTSLFNIDRNGTLLMPLSGATTLAAASLTFGSARGNSAAVAISAANNTIYGFAQNQQIFFVNITKLALNANQSVTWTSSTTANDGAPDLFLLRDAANILAQRNANTGQIHRVGYNWTDASNYSYAVVDAGQTTANTIALGSRSVGAPAQKLTKLRVETDNTLVADYAVTTASTFTLAPAVALGTVATDATHTDATVCRDTTTGLLLAGSGAVGICLGTSSMRFKHDIAPAIDGLAAVMALKPVTYRYNLGHVDGGKTVKYGFLAEDVVGVLPKLVGLDIIGRPNSVDMIGFVPILARAIQELKLEVDQLRSNGARSR